MRANQVGSALRRVDGRFLYKRVGRTRDVQKRIGRTTDGLNGGWIFLAISSFQSMALAKNGWRLISSAPLTPRRCAGSRVKRPTSRVRASEPTSSGKRSGSCRILAYLYYISKSGSFADSP